MRRLPLAQSLRTSAAAGLVAWTALLSGAAAPAAAMPLVVATVRSSPAHPPRAHADAAAEPLVEPMRELGAFGGRFVVASGNDARTFNPSVALETNSIDVTDRLFTGLAEFDNATLDYRPSLARAWELSADGRSCVWHLRRGARFSDGRPITSADVVFSFAVACDTTLHSPLRDGLVFAGRAIEVSAPDAYTVVTRVAAPTALLVAAVASVRVLPRHVLEAAWRGGTFASAYGVGTAPDSLVTSGPWKLESFAPGEKTVLARNPYWFGVDAKRRRLPYLDRLVFLVVRDQAAAALKFQANDGELDAVDNVKAEDYALYEREQARGDFTLYDLGPSLSSYFFWFNLNTLKRPLGERAAGTPAAGAVDVAWFANRDFRRAVSKAIDRDAMIRSVYFGAGVKSWSVITPGNRRFASATPSAWDYDVDGARRLLAEQGFVDRDGDGVLEDAAGHPLRFNLMTNANSNVRVQLANFVRDDLAHVGIACTLTPIDFNSMIGHLQNDFDYQAALGGLTGLVPPDPAAGAGFYRSDGATHFWNAAQPAPSTPAEARLDSLFDALAASRSAERRRALSAAMDRLIDDECWVIWLPVPVVKLPVRNRIGNVQPSSLRHRLLWNSETLFVRPTAAR